MRKISFLVLAIALGFAATGRSQDLCPQKPTGTFCVTTPLAASGNGSCVVNMCFSYDLSKTPKEVSVTSYQVVGGTNCSSIVTDLFGVTNDQALAEALEKEAIRITVERCERCFPPGARLYTAKSPACRYKATNGTWLPCPGNVPPDLHCESTYSVTCDPSNPYTWIWGPPGGSIVPDWGTCGGAPGQCVLTCPW